MKIERILNQNRRDFTAIYKCEHCGTEKEGRGYDDANFHQSVIPKMKCIVCEKTSASDYIPRETKYNSWEIV